ncbi:MAG: glycosyltransferase family 4 protein [Rhizobiales bacterium]|nr:glycosyltransferase family 4 protein [Hyphomicrobiales bacterium]NRB13163.1 glycosyltransferase family 4 protein [Hyphomicrobiales bacterium]
MTKKAKLLCILHLAPPAHGAAKVGEFVANSQKLHHEFECKYITIRTSDSIESLQRFSLKKLYYAVYLWVQILLTLLFFWPQKIYFTASVNGLAFYRDLSVSLLWKAYSVFTKVDIYYHYHTQGVDEFVAKSNMNLQLTRFLLNNVNLILLSPILLADFKKVPTYKQILYLPNGVEDGFGDEEFELYINDKFRNTGKTVNILFLSNMIKSKGYFEVLELAKLSVGKNIHFNFAGAWQSKQDEAEFYEYIQNNNLEQTIKFLGFVNEQEKRKLLLESNLFVYPTKNDAFPLTILEALSFGIPCISTPVGSIPYILNKDTGIMLTEEVDLPTALIQALSAYNDRSTALNCRQRFRENFTLTIFEDNLIDILKNQLTIY